MRKLAPLTLNALSVLALTTILVFLAAILFRTQPSEAAVFEAEPVAVLKTILINGNVSFDANESQVLVMSAGSSQPVTTGMPLSAGDEVSTGFGVKVTILFLENSAETDNEVSLDQNSRVQVGSLFSWLGRVVVSVKGAFETKTTRARWSVRGTEYELVVESDGTNTLRVLKGAVEAEQGDYVPVAKNKVVPEWTNKTFSQSVAFSSPRGQTRRSHSAGPTQSLVANKLDKVTLPPSAVLNKTALPLGEINQTLRWSDPILVAGQPTYAPQSAVPHVPTWPERDELFRRARRGSIVIGDRKSYDLLAQVYLDWGRGAKAQQQLKGAIAKPQTVEDYTKIGEANRLMGKLNEAETTLHVALKINPHYQRARNELGNVFMDRARVALEMLDSDLAKKYISAARAEYTRALELSARTPPDESRRAEKTTRRNENHAGLTTQKVPLRADLAQLVSQSNLGEADLELGRVLQREGRAAEALKHFEAAEQSFKLAERDIDKYPFPTRGLGDVYRGIRSVALRLRDKDKANAAFRLSQQKYSEAIAAHNDFAEAYVGLGNLFFESGRRKEALSQYEKAIKVRPEKPEAFYRTAVVFANEGASPLAAKYASVYLKLQPTELRRGRKTNNALLVRKGNKPEPEPEIREALPDSDPVPPNPEPEPPTPQPPPGGPTVEIPGMRGDKPEDAVRELQKKLLKPKLAYRPDCDGSNKVVFTDPPQGRRVPRYSEVTIFVSSFGDDPASVPPLKGVHVKDAEALLENMKLTLRVTRREEREDYKPDEIVWQKPDAGKKLKRDCEVEVRIAAPIPPSVVPELTGKDVTLAEQLLFNARLWRGDVTEVDSHHPPGTVIAQSEPAGKMVPRFTRVHVTISRLGVLVPNVIGMSRAKAIETLKAAGLNGQVVEGDSEVGEVYEQDPPGGKRVPKGTVVKLKFPIGENLRE